MNLCETVFDEIENIAFVNSLLLLEQKSAAEKRVFKRLRYCSR